MDYREEVKRSGKSLNGFFPVYLGVLISTSLMLFQWELEGYHRRQVYVDLGNGDQ